MKIFLTIVVFHWVEHLIQGVQLYALGWELHESRGVLGYFIPWLAHSETLHYSYALVMLLGLYVLLSNFSGVARKWWMAALLIQFWHHSEHLLLLYQAWSGSNFFNAPQPISVMQFLGFFKGSAESGFGGLLGMSHFGVCSCAGAAPGTVHRFEPLLLLVRRPELHLIYNTLVTAPMLMAMWKARPKTVKYPMPAINAVR